MPAPQSSAHAAPSAAAPAAPGYIIAYVDVTRPEQYEEYRRWSSLAIETHGAQICVRGGQVAVLEGDWEPERVVMLMYGQLSKALSCTDFPGEGFATSFSKSFTGIKFSFRTASLSEVLASVALLRARQLKNDL